MTFIMGEDFKSISIADLAPTQVTVGMREVDVKRRLWNEKHAHKAADYFNTHRFPVILGPHARHYLIDHHHLALALQDEGIWELPVSVVANMSMLGFDEFWTPHFTRIGRAPFRPCVGIGDEFGAERRCGSVAGLAAPSGITKVI